MEVLHAQFPIETCITVAGLKLNSSPSLLVDKLVIMKSCQANKYNIHIQPYFASPPTCPL